MRKTELSSITSELGVASSGNIRLVTRAGNNFASSSTFRVVVGRTSCKLARRARAPSRYAIRPSKNRSDERFCIRSSRCKQSLSTARRIYPLRPAIPLPNATYLLFIAMRCALGATDSSAVERYSLDAIITTLVRLRCDVMSFIIRFARRQRAAKTMCTSSDAKLARRQIVGAQS